MSERISKESKRIENITHNEYTQVLEALKSTLLLGGIALPKKEYRNGSPAGIYIGLRMGFPEIVGNPLTQEGKEKVDDIYAMVEYLVSFNLIVDDVEGIEKVLKENPTHPKREILDAALVGYKAYWARSKEKMIKTFGSHGREEEAHKISDVFERDLEQLVVKGENIHQLSEEEAIVRREYDNATFVLACAATLYGTDKFKDEYSSMEMSFEQRYSWLLDDIVPEDPIRKWTKVLHKTYVSVGIYDDIQGCDDDVRFGLVTYPTYLRQVKGMNAQQISDASSNVVQDYDSQAKRLGMGKIVRGILKGGAKIAEYPQRQKERWIREPLLLDDLKRGGINYLREKLVAKGYI